MGRSALSARVRGSPEKGHCGGRPCRLGVIRIEHTRRRAEFAPKIFNILIYRYPIAGWHGGDPVRGLKAEDNIKNFVLTGLHQASPDRILHQGIELIPENGNEARIISQAVAD